MPSAVRGALQTRSLQRPPYMFDVEVETAADSADAGAL